MPELLIGCGNHREKTLKSPARPDWTALTTVDIDPNCGADVEWDISRLPLPFDDESFDEIHAYHVLEHVGGQGDYRFFFAQFEDFWRLLKPDGIFAGIVPAPGSPWIFGDPGHTRFFAPELLTYLDQTQYVKQVGTTAFADYRHVYRADFEIGYIQIINNADGAPDQFCFAMRAQKPARLSR